MKLLAFDIEIATIIPKGVNWEFYRPFGIAVAATLLSDQQLAPDLWYGRRCPGTGTEPLSQMPMNQAQDLVKYLRMRVDQGYTIVTWNGLSFDFRVLAEESGLWAECKELALGHLDVMFQFFCEKGFAIGLNAAALGMGLQGKPEGMDGAKAPVLWEAGRYQEVMDYVAQDVQVTLDVAQVIMEQGHLVWLSSTGRAYTWYPRAERLLRAGEAIELPLPTPPGWIANPWPREQFTSWVLPAGGEDSNV